MIKDNLERIEKDIIAACAHSKRKREQVVLVAVSKNQAAERIMEAYACGVRVFGENRVQELIGKMDLLPGDIEWHMIGSLQRNKVKYIVGKVKLIHSVDSVRLAEEISKQACKLGVVQDVLVEVNVAGEDTKQGASLGEAESLVREICGFRGIKVRGLMTIAPYVVNGAENRPYFAKLKQLSVDITAKSVDNVSMDGFRLLSMGMTGDYVVAIEEGADFIRVGTGIFDGI